MEISHIVGSIPEAHPAYFEIGRGYSGLVQSITEFRFTPSIRDHDGRPGEAIKRSVNGAAASRAGSNK